MPDYYLQFSCCITLDTPAKHEWAAKTSHFLTLLAANDGVIEDIEPYIEGAELAELDIAHQELWPAEDYLGLSFTYDQDFDRFWILSDESGTVTHAVPIIQSYLKTCDPEGSFGFEWSYSSSSLYAAGGFGGGAVFVTATVAAYLDTGVWLAERFHAHEQNIAAQDDETAF